MLSVKTAAHHPTGEKTAQFQRCCVLMENVHLRFNRGLIVLGCSEYFTQSSEG